MSINRKEIARRIAYRDGYNIGDIDDVLKTYEAIITEALRNGEEVKHGTLYKIIIQDLPEKKAWDGLNKRSFIRPAKSVPKFRALKQIKDIEFLLDDDEE